MMKKLYTFLVLVLFLPLSTMAQMHYPIRTNTIVTPPVPFSLDGFVSQPGKLMLNVLVDDVTLSQYPVKLQLHIEGNGIRISSNPNIPQQPIYLDGGVTTQLTGSDLEFYFNPENLLFQGYSLSEYRRNGRLPEGVYRIRFEVLDFYRDFKVSSAIPAVAMMSLTNGPVLTFPANRSEIDVDANPVLRFSWMAVFTAIPDALIEYRFKLWQIRPDNRDPFEITKVTTPVYEVDLSETALLYDGSLPPLEKGARYVWQVTALDLSGNVLFKKDGNSDIATFRYGYECAAPSAVISKVSHNSVSVSWNSNSSIREYIVSYRKENDPEWQEVTTSNVGLTIDNLEHSVQYELYVRASCGDASSSNERLLRFKTDRFVDYSCGAGAPRISFENQDPLPALHRFDEFKAADFYIEVTEVSGSQGVFSGRGLASIPFLEFLKFEVSFNDITINTDRQMIDGHVVFLHEEETGKIPGRNMGVGGSQGAEGSQELSFEEALNEIADQKVTIDEEVADVSVSNGNVTVVTESGQTQSYLVGENQTLAIVTPESIVVVDQASGQVFQAPNTPPGSSSNVRTPSQSGIHGCLVTFRPSATQRLGFDAVGNGVVKPNSYFLRDRNGDAVPWKSLEAGNTDYVAMLTNGDCQADSLRFIRESGLLSPTTPGRNNSLELLLTGGFQGQEERLTVARATTNHINDSTSEEILTEAGVLGLVSYQRITRDVFLIPVNGASFPTASTQLSDIEKRLNEIYGSAVINWNVHFDEPIEVGRINEADFKVEGTAMLSKYTSDMNRVIRTYKRNRPADDNSLYLFFVELSDLGTSRKGFMPLAGNFGFIFNFSASDFDLLAHELAHGAFNLRHTFSDKAQHYFPVQQTANLMDYAGGTDLWKYQWDLIHNPESILFAWGQDEEEGAAIIAESMTVQAIVDSLKYHYENRQTDTLRIMQWKNKSSIKEKVSIASSDGKHVEFNVEVMWVSYDGTDITDTTEFVPFRHTQDFIKFKLTDYSLIIKDEQGNCLHLETYSKNNIINLIEYIGITRTMLGLECKDNDGNIDIACTILNLIKDGIAQEDTIFTLPYQYCSTGSHTTKITHNDKTFSVHVVPGLCTSSSNRKFSLQEKDKRTIGNKEAFVFVRSDVFSLDGATTVRVEKNYVEDLDSYLFGSNVLDDGTIIGDPVKDCRLVPSGTHGLHGGRFGCTRTWGSTCNDNKECYSYLTTRGPGIGLGTTFHSGVDIYAANGTPLYSILQGTVVDIHNIDDNDLGKSITIKSTTNIGVVYLMYCHLSEIEVKVGDEVKKGDNIGKTGITGNASSIAVSRRHVHIEASTDGVFWGGTTRIDPEQFITTKFDINGNPIKLK